MSTRRDRAASAVALGIWPHVEITDPEMVEAYRIADMVLAEVDRIPHVSELTAPRSQTDDGAVRSPATPRAVPHPAARAGVTGWRPAPSSPVLPRSFLLFRTKDVTGMSGTGVVGWGVEFPDGSAALRWATAHPSTVAWPSVDDIVAVHGHQGATVIRWLDTTIGGN